MNKQVVPVPEYLSPMIQDGGKFDQDVLCFDAVAYGWSVFYVFEQNFKGECELECFYAVDPYGIDAEVHGCIMVPTKHCKKCGRRMTVADRKYNDKETTYKCDCGEVETRIESDDQET